MERLGLNPQSLAVFFAREPASVQERWFARMYFVKPLLFAILSLFWISTAAASLGPGWGYGIDLLREGGVEGRAAALTVIAGALADLLIGIAIACRADQPLRTLRRSCHHFCICMPRHDARPPPVG